MIAGMQVTISAPGLGKCYGRVESVEDVDQLPRIAEADEIAQAAGYPDSGIAAREILAEQGVTRIAAISYYATRKQQVVFVAMQIGGEWRDLKGQLLTIEVLN